MKSWGEESCQVDGDEIKPEVLENVQERIGNDEWCHDKTNS